MKKRFIEGLKKYNLTKEDIENSNYKFIGGDNEVYSKRGEKILGKEKFQEILENTPKKDKCICNHSIKVNCYIQSNSCNILVLGFCCIKKFIPNGLNKICENCGEKHNNRKDNKCNICRMINCLMCSNKIENKYTKCLNCIYKT